MAGPAKRARARDAGVRPVTAFVKLYGSILDSTVWRESHTTVRVWIAMLAMADVDGVVEASIPGLADRARVTLDECEDALERLSSPDRYSRTRDHEGRRVEAVDGGWRVLNHRAYRERRGASAERVARHRARKREDDAPASSVYFAADDHSRVKIGVSSNPWARVAEIRSLDGDHVRLLATIPGDRATERGLHMRFGEQWISGEWYRLEGKLADLVVTLGNGVTAEAEAEADTDRIRDHREHHVAPSQPVEAERAEAPSVAISVQVAKQEDPPPEVASLPLRLIPEQPEDRNSTRGLARRLWEWHERERIDRLHGGKGSPRKPLDREHLDRIVALVRKVAKQEGILERPAFLRVHEFRRRAIEQARLALAGEDPAWARKLVAWCRNESAWSLKAYDSVMAAEADAVAVASSRPVSPPGTIDGDPLSAVEATAWRDAFSSTGDAGIARMAVVALRRSPNEPRGVIDVTSPPAKVHNPFAIGGAK